MMTHPPIPDPYLRRIFTQEDLVVPATDGRLTLANCGLFRGGVEGIDISIRSGYRTPDAPVRIYEAVKAGSTIPEIRRSRDLSRPHLQQGQIVAFCQKYRKLFVQEKCEVFFELGEVLLVRALLPPKGDAFVVTTSDHDDLSWAEGRPMYYWIFPELRA